MVHLGGAGKQLINRFEAGPNMIGVRTEGRLRKTGQANSHPLEHNISWPKVSPAMRHGTHSTTHMAGDDLGQLKVPGGLCSRSIG